MQRVFSDLQWALTQSIEQAHRAMLDVLVEVAAAESWLVRRICSIVGLKRANSVRDPFFSTRPWQARLCCRT